MSKNETAKTGLLLDDLDNSTLVGLSTDLDDENALPLSLALLAIAGETVTGTAGNDTLNGTDGDDVIDGGAGADRMTGGAGDDTYVVDNAGDVTIEETGGGTDTVRSSITLTLAANVENLVLLGSAGISGTGNSLDNVLTGNSANNVLTGLAGNDILDGGAGADRMDGGIGDDIYVFDNTGDTLVEGSNGGTDTVRSSITLTLGNANVENLVLIGSANINGSGNSVNNVLTGNAGANVLSGGSGNDTLSGLAGDDTLDGGAGADRMDGGAGNDTYVVDDAGDVVLEDSADGIDTVRSSIALTLAANVENLVLLGSGSINGTGNGLANTLTGNSGNNGLSGAAGNDTLLGFNGNDTLDGGTGADQMEGGTGNDIYVVDNSGDILVEAVNAGTDTVQSSITFTLDDNFENLLLLGAANIDAIGNSVNNTLTGNSGNNRLEGGAGSDVLLGGAGNDTLDGGTSNDRMEGGEGNDLYFVENGSDAVIEAASAGTDTVRSSVNFVLGANLENLVLLGASALNGNGNDIANTLTGNGAVNVLKGFGGDDTLDGGAGADRLEGGTGDDFYIVETVGDVAAEGENSGTDTVQSTIDFVLGSNVENLLLAGSANINGTGNNLNNRLTGTSGNNVLNGGTGVDMLDGGNGDDTYVVDNLGDMVIEVANGGSDTVQSSITLTLGYEVENLVLLGSAALSGTGNALDNTLTGNTGANILSGDAGRDTLRGLGGNDTLDGGAGIDTLEGGLGDDTYLVSDADDLIVEAAGAGIDTVRSSATLTLSANVENLVLLGAEALSGTGNALNNTLTGNTGDNTLDGRTGADRLVGGDGNDTYVVDNTGDVIVETTNAGTDTVRSSITLTLGNDVENMVLIGTASINGTGNSGNNAISGNTGANTLSGAAGNDTLSGLAGDDTLDGGADADQMDGGAGDDTYVVDNAGDVVVELAGEGTDTVRTSIALTLAANVENLVLLGSASINGTGNGLANTLTGNSGANGLSGAAGNDTLIGLDGNDTLDGGTGADTLDGGNGNDTYVVDNAGDVIFETSSGGTDTVQTTIELTLGDNLENLLLLGAAALSGTGNSLNNVLTGNDGANSLFGALGNDTLLGGAGNDTLDGGFGNDRMEGGAGDDTYVMDVNNDVIVEAASAGIDTVQTRVNYTLGDNLENVVLLGTAIIGANGNSLDNSMIGNSGANTLKGNAGNDTLDGGGGADRLEGGTGDDIYVVDVAGDVVVEAAGAGTDTVRSSVSLGLGDNIERLVLLGTANLASTGNSLDNVMTGNSGANSLNGAAGNDSLNGLDGNDTLDGGAGIDRLAGGNGNDTYISDGVDIIVEDVDGGIDTVRSSSNNAALGANVENLVLLGSSAIDGTGNILDNVLTGNAGANTLQGLDGDDRLDGGAGADRLEGGAGDDTYIVDDAGDVVVEVAGEGTDTVNSSIALTLGAELENLVLLGLEAINGTGNELANALTGNAGANVLTGLAGNDTLNGGAGADTLDGGEGNDTYVIDNIGDVIIEAADGGTDTVRSSISLTLGADLENLVLLGSSAINGVGNGLANTLSGNIGNNSLSGDAGNDTLQGLAGNDTLNGGIGADRMEGGVGNDTYVVDNASDVVVEAANAGTDTLRSSLSLTLGANVENLVLLGAGNLNGTGNGLANSLTGNAGANVLNGGTGADRMAGGTGNDTYVVDNVGDVVIEAANAGLDLVRSTISQTLGANVENLVLLGSGNINGTGNTLNNALNGNTGANVLTAGAGNDTLTGLAGNDRLIGGTGADKLFGGAGADRFVFTNFSDSTVAVAGRDMVFDFSRAQGDKVDLAALDANSGLSGNQAFTFIGETAFTGAAGQLRYVNQNGDTFVQADINGDRVADFAIGFDATIDFVRGDFIL